MSRAVPGLKATARRRVSANTFPPAVVHAATGDGEQKAAIESAYRESQLYREVCVQWLLNKLRSEEHRRNAETNYSLPAWGQHQADCNGSIRTIEEVLKNLFGVKIYGAEQVESILPGDASGQEEEA